MGGPATATGAKLGRYQIVKHLASGGMAEVLLARAVGIEGFTRHVVIKRIRPGQAKDQTFVQMFLNEARIAAQLHHANIVQVHDIGQEGTEYFIAMEYVHGEDLRRLLTHLARHKLKTPLEHVVTIIGAAAVALHHAHEQLGPDRKPLGIVHRDVTPANILIGYDGNVKVVDFGIAKAALKTEETQAGVLKGKASYMSPEQCTGSKVDRRSDVFALGIVLYELVTTRRLFKADNDFLTMSAIVAGKIPPPTTHRPDLPSALEAIIMKALALEPGKRYQSCDAMREALEQFAAQRGLRTSTSGLASYMKQQFGERPEPWLVDDDEPEMELTVDFDGSASAIVSPPEESIHQLAIPKSVEVINSSPIAKARTKAITAQPSNAAQVAATPKRQLPLSPPGVPAKKQPMTAQIPVVHVPPASEKSRPFRIDSAPVPAVPRRNPITVQIPTATQTAGAAVPKRVESSALPGVPDVDAKWDPSKPVPQPADLETKPVVQHSPRAITNDGEAPTNVLDPQPLVKVIEPAGKPAPATKPAAVAPAAKPVAVAPAAKADAKPLAAKPDAKPIAAPAQKSNGAHPPASPTVASRKTPPLAFPQVTVPASKPVGSVTKPSAPDVKPEPKVVVNIEDTPPPLPPVLPAGAEAKVVVKVEDTPLPLPPVLPAGAEAKARSRKEDASSKFDVASLSSSRTDVSGLPPMPVAAAAPSAADAIAAADAAADAEPKRSDGRDSAPSLPPPPAGRKSVKLPGVAELPSAAPGGIAAKFAAPGFEHPPHSASTMPEAWPGGSSSFAISKLFGTPKRIAIAAGALVGVVVVIVFALGGDSKPSAAPDKPDKPVTMPVTEPVQVTPPVAPPVDEVAPPSDETDPPVKPVVKPPAKKPPKKPATKPAVKPGTKPTKPPGKKWDPDTLFPTRK